MFSLYFIYAEYFFGNEWYHYAIMIQENAIPIMDFFAFAFILKIFVLKKFQWLIRNFFLSSLYASHGAKEKTNFPTNFNIPSMLYVFSFSMYACELSFTLGTKKKKHIQHNHVIIVIFLCTLPKVPVAVTATLAWHWKTATSICAERLEDGIGNDT